MADKIKNIYTKEQILNMTDEQWHQFRLESWKKRQEYYSKPAPIWYLRDREAYAKLLEQTKKVHDIKSVPSYERKGEMTKKIDDLAAGYEDEFADEY